MDVCDVERYAACGDAEGLHRALESEIRGAARSVARKVPQACAEDLAQEGALVLLAMLDRWRPERGPFLGLFRSTIRQELAATITGPIAIPRNVERAARTVRDGEELLEAASRYGVNPANVEAALDLVVLNLDRIDLAEDQDEGVRRCLDDLIVDDVARMIILDVASDGLEGAASVYGVSRRTMKRRFDQALRSVGYAA